MKKTVFTGSGVAIVTPMHQDGTVNFEDWDGFWNFKLKTVPTLSLSVVLPENPLP